MAKSKSEIEIARAGTDEAAFAEVFDLLVRLHKEGGYAPLDVEKAAEACFRVLDEGMVFVARADGKAIGTIALVALPFWYSTQTHLQDAWFYVVPERRRGQAGVRLLRAVRDEAQARNKIAFITVNNPDRRPKKTKAAIESQTLGLVPVGYTLTMKGK